MSSSSNANTSSPIEKYPYPTKFNVLDFVPKLLGATNYEKWKKLMQDFIARRGLIDLIGDTAEEKITNRECYEARKRSDDLVQGWMLATLTEDIRLQMVDQITASGLRVDQINARDLWRELHNNFNRSLSSWRPDEETRHLPLLKAVIKGDWEVARGIIEHDPVAVRTPLTPNGETALMVAVRSKGGNFVRKLLDKMTPQDVSLSNIHGNTALHTAAYRDNIVAARMLVNKNSHLPNDYNINGYLPLHYAAGRGWRTMVVYLKRVTSEDAIFTDPDRLAFLLKQLTQGELYDIALSLLQRNPEVAIASVEPSPLDIIVEKYSSFKSRNFFNMWQKLIYWGVPKKSGSISNRHNGGGDIEEPANCCISVRQRLHFMLWEVAENLVSHIKSIREQKEKQHHALELVKFLCVEVAKSPLSRIESIFKPVLGKATYVGISEIVEEIILAYPFAIGFMDQDYLNIFQYAIQCRREHVFNLIYQTNVGSEYIAATDRSRNNGLHLAARLKNEQQIILRANAAGPVLQLQRELQWFKEVEKSAELGVKETRNIDGMTPAEVFSETHQNLVKDGEKWMKDTATSCTIVAALIATMVFAAAITVPGGNNSDNGLPILSKQKAFVIFGISDALALFSSITSVLMFLLILTSRYAEEDFLHTLPNRLVIGLINLFVSILSTMVAFGAILFLVFGYNKEWVLIPVIALATIPATLFGALQFPLLVEMIQSTYGGGLFGKQSDRVLR